MAFNVDLDSVKPLDDTDVSVAPLRGADYNPMRRKLAVDGYEENGF